jgi:hypothetical protein
LIQVGKSIHEFRWLTGEPPSPNAVTEEPLFFSGEMIYPFMFQTSPELEKLSAVAHHLAEYPDWPDLYDEWQCVLHSPLIIGPKLINCIAG